MNGKYPLVYIEWCDAIAGSHSWKGVSEALEWADSSEWIVKQSGFLIKETKKYILIASKLQDEDEPLVGGVMKIPQGWIRKCVPISL